MAKKSQQQSKRKKANAVKDLSAGPKVTNVKAGEGSVWFQYGVGIVKVPDHRAVTRT